jgi:hypothetical protein
MNVTIFNLKITLDLCLEEHKCLELRHVCGHYRFVAVYLPDFPKDEEYTFSCSIATLINVGMGIFSFFCALVTFVTIGAYCRRSRQQAMYDTIENLNVRSNERGSVRFQAAPRPIPTASNQQPQTSPTTTEHLFPFAPSPTVEIHFPANITISRNLTKEKKKTEKKGFFSKKKNYGSGGKKKKETFETTDIVKEAKKEGSKKTSTGFENPNYQQKSENEKLNEAAGGMDM